MEYILVLIATLLYSSQFLMTQLYSKRNGKGIKSVLTYNSGTYLIIALYMFVANGFKMQITLFSVLISVISAISAVAGTYASIASLNVANLSLYSVFMMSGPVVISAITGFLFFDESITLGVLIGIVLIAVSLYLSIDKKQKGGKGAVKYYFLCFFLNGTSGIIAKIHQMNTDINIPSNDFLILRSLTTVVISILLLVIVSRGNRPFEYFASFKNIGIMAGYSGFHGIAELIGLITLSVLPVSLQQPLVTGGVLTFSFIISALRREKLTTKSIISFIFSLLATICISLLTKPII